MEEAWSSIDGLGWLLLLLGPLLLLLRALHRELQMVLLLLTRRTGATIMLFSLLFLPGVFLHELSHYLTARLLRVPTGRFSIIPKPIPGGRLQMGVVQTGQTDTVRDALIGVAPLLAGGAAIAFVGLFQTNLYALGQMLLAGDWGGLWQGLLASPYQPDFWLWFYLVFVISSTMFPSASDRRAWLPILLVAAGLLLLAMVTGAGPWLRATVAPGFNRAMRAVAVIFAISLGVHLVLLFPTWVVRRALNKITGLRVD